MKQSVERFSIQPSFQRTDKYSERERAESESSHYSVYLVDFLQLSFRRLPEKGLQVIRYQEHLDFEVVRGCLPDLEYNYLWSLQLEETHIRYI